MKRFFFKITLSTDTGGELDNKIYSCPEGTDESAAIKYAMKDWVLSTRDTIRIEEIAATNRDVTHLDPLDEVE